GVDPLQYVENLDRLGRVDQRVTVVIGKDVDAVGRQEEVPASGPEVSAPLLGDSVSVAVDGEPACNIKPLVEGDGFLYVGTGRDDSGTGKDIPIDKHRVLPVAAPFGGNA